MLRALDAATSTLKIVASGIRRGPMNVPSRSDTAITILAVDPSGRRMAARVMFAVASAWSRIVITCAAVRPPRGPLVGVIRSPSGGCPVLLIGENPGTYAPVPATGPAVKPLGMVV